MRPEGGVVRINDLFMIFRYQLDMADSERGMAFKRIAIIFIECLLIVLTSQGGVCACMISCGPAAEPIQRAGAIVSITGNVFCVKYVVCKFVPEPQAHNMVTLDIAGLTQGEVHHLFSDCEHEKPCKMLVSGEMLTSVFLAIETDAPND